MLPPMGFAKMNVDTGIVGDGLIAFEVIFQDSQGQVLAMCI